LVSLLLAVFTQTFTCHPVNAQWNLNVKLYDVYNCHGTWQTPFAWAIIFAVTDLWLVTLPVSLIWGLHRPPLERFGISFLFILGLIATFVTFAKLPFIKLTYSNYDETCKYQAASIC